MAAGQRPGRAPPGASPAAGRDLASISAELARLIRYDDESIVNSRWLRQRHASGGFAGYGPARQQVVRVAWHEAGHAVAALAAGARFSSVSIHHGSAHQGVVRGISGAGDLAFAVHAAGQIAERLMDWTMLDRDADLRQWLATWRRDGGDAVHFRQTIGARFGGDEAAAWRYSEQLLLPRRLSIRQVARALLVHPRHLPYAVVAAIAAPGK